MLLKDFNSIRSGDIAEIIVYDNNGNNKIERPRMNDMVKYQDYEVCIIGMKLKSSECMFESVIIKGAFVVYIREVK